MNGWPLSHTNAVVRDTLRQGCSRYSCAVTLTLRKGATSRAHIMGARKADILWSRGRNASHVVIDSRPLKADASDTDAANRAVGSSTDQRKLRILHLVVRLGAPNTQYNEHCLPLVGRRDIAICAYFKDASLVTPSEIALFDGGGKVRGFLRALKAAHKARSYDVVHAHAPQTGFLLALSNLLGRRSMRNAVYTVHNCFQNYSIRNQLLLFAVFLAFPRITLCSHSVLESLPRILRRIGGGRMSIISNSVDTERVDRVLSNIDRVRRNGNFTAISVSRLIERKDPLGLMEAFGRADLEDADLVFVGDGELGPELADRASSLGLKDRIRFTGMVARDDVYRFTAGADVYLSTSRGEGLPIAVLEAMACGVPVILSDIPPHREIAQGVDFIPLVAPGEGEGFAQELRRFRDLPPDVRASIGRRCREIVEQRFSLWAMHRSYDRVYAAIERREGSMT